MQHSPSEEYRLIKSIGAVLGACSSPDKTYPLTLGDDAAVRRSGNERLIITADISVENVHFTLDTASFREIGYKAMVTNVSDCAAMGAVPESALVQLVFPKNSAALHKNIADIYRGFAKACNEWGFKIIGGDLSGGAVWTIGITLIGRAAEKDHILKRKGARSGDILWVSGFPGQSAAGLAAIQKFGRKKAQMLYPELVGSHIRPAARVSLGTKLARCPSVHAGMDLSDGLSKDCRTLCFENRLGLELSFDGLRVPDEMISLSEKLGVPWQEWALHGGEEYELLFATSRQFDLTSFAEKNREIIPIGVFTKIPDELIFIKGSVRTKVAKKSYDHVAIRKNK